MFGFSRPKSAESDPRHTEANYHMAEGIAKSRDHKLREALAEFQQAQGLFESIPHLPGIAAALQSKAQTYRDAGDVRGLAFVFREAQATAARAANLDSKNHDKGETYRVLGECADLCDVSDQDGDGTRLDFSQDCYQRATTLLELVGDTRNTAAAWNNLAMVHHQRFRKFLTRQPCGDELGYEQARRAYGKALDTNQRSGNQEAALRNQRNLNLLDNERRQYS